MLSILGKKIILQYSSNLHFSYFKEADSLSIYWISYKFASHILTDQAFAIFTYVLDILLSFAVAFFILQKLVLRTRHGGTYL